jgi:hypothetical protein
MPMEAGGASDSRGDSSQSSERRKDDTNIQLKAAEHYNSRQDKKRKLDSNLETLQQKNMNNWVKAILIATSVKPGCSILDLACGKVIAYRPC